MTNRDTIFALSSGRPPAAIAVIRISGPRAGAALSALGVKTPEPRKAGFARIRDSVSGEIIDEGLVLWFPGPKSETGEDVAELQPHGGRAVIAAILAALARVEGLRPAEAGEFTRRAFENGKLDLTAVEGLADLVMAETEGQRRQAFRQMQGALGRQAESWREKLIRAQALVEARIDFSDEADVPEDLVAPALALVRELEAEVAAALADGGRGERLREGVVVAIAGPPNAGKSTVLNRIARREAAIVSPYAGTTRDVIEVHLDLGGLPVTLLDTAGIRETSDPVELEGVRRARERAAAADLVLWVVDGSAGDVQQAELVHSRSARAECSPPPCGEGLKVGVQQATGAGVVSNPLPNPPPQGGREPAEIGAVSVSKAAFSTELSEESGVGSPSSLTSSRSAPADGGSTSPESAVSQVSTAPRPPVWLVRNKMDLVSAHRKSEPKDQHNDSNNRIDNKESPTKNELQFSNTEVEFSLSAVSGEGFDAFVAGLARFAEQYLAGAEPALITRERHRRTLADTLAALRRASDPGLSGREGLLAEELLAEELRVAARALGRLTGRVDVEDILDVIFRDFCIGK